MKHAMVGLWAFLTATALAAEPQLVEPGRISTGADESHPSFSADGRTMWFLRNTPDFLHWTVMETQWRQGRWQAPHVAAFSGRWDDAYVFATRDGQQLYFISNRPVDGHAHADTDLWVMHRSADRWSPPRRIAELSSDGYEWFPTLTDSGTIYFGSERPGGHGASDLWRAQWLGDRFSEPENLGDTFNSGDQEIEPLVAPDERWLIFAARGRKDGSGAYDLFISFHCAAGWSAPLPLRGGVNSSAWDFGPRLSADGKEFWFSSNRARPRPDHLTTNAQVEAWIGQPGNGLRDIYRLPLAEALPPSPCVSP